jgi:hypothetical protein
MVLTILLVANGHAGDPPYMTAFLRERTRGDFIDRIESSIEILYPDSSWVQCHQVRSVTQSLTSSRNAR